MIDDKYRLSWPKPKGQGMCLPHVYKALDDPLVSVRNAPTAAEVWARHPNELADHLPDASADILIVAWQEA